MEDFREYPANPAPAIAADARELIRALGGALFTAIFGGPEAAALWSLALPVLPDLDFEVDAHVAARSAVPFELLRDPGSGLRPAVAARSFTHVSGAADDVRALEPPLRILLVICRPALAEDVPFRTIAGRLLRALPDQGGIRVDVLRPATFAALEQALAAAAAEGSGYQVVHFDGHGVVASVDGSPERGYAVFEHASPAEVDLVAGDRIGRALADAGVDVLVLNACRSGRAVGDPTGPDPRGFGSLAHAALDAGLSAVVAMRYNVYVPPAATFVSTLYHRLFAGDPLAEAVSRARAALPPDNDDWLVPVVLQRRAVRMVLTGERPDAPAPAEQDFHGRDDVIIRLDRAFDRARVVLLWGGAGVGKTALAREFAAWYRQTGGAGTVRTHALSDTDPDRLSALLDDASDGPHRVLLIARSRSPWLPDDVERVQLLPLSAVEQAELAGAWRLSADAADFALGNPRALHLLRAGGHDVSRLRAGLDVLDPSAGDLDVGDLSEAQHVVLATLPLFRGVVTAHHLVAMARRLGVDGIDHAAVTALLDRVTDAGFLTLLEAGFYGLNPFLPALVRPYLDSCPFTEADLRDAYCHVFAMFGHGLFWAFNQGNRDVLNIIAMEEPNLLHARELALDSGRHDDVIGAMQALHMLYEQAHRNTDWKALVHGLSPALLDPATLLPHADRFLGDPSLDGILLEYAEQHSRAAPDAVARARALLDARWVAFLSTQDNADLRRALLRHRAVRLIAGEAEADVREGLDLAHRIGDVDLEIHALLKLADMISLRGEFGRARAHYDQAHRLVPATDARNKVRIFDGLGALHLSQAEHEMKQQLVAAAKDTGLPRGRVAASLDEDLVELLGLARQYTLLALHVQGVDDWATTGPLHHRLGGLARYAGNWAEADTHYRKAIEGHERAGNAHHAALSRLDFAAHLVDRGERHVEALRYAEAALRACEALGARAEREAKWARLLVEELSPHRSRP